MFSPPRPSGFNINTKQNKTLITKTLITMEESFTKQNINNFLLFLSLLFSTIFIGLGIILNMWDFLQYTGAFFVFYWCYRIFIWITDPIIVNLLEAFIAIMSFFIMIMCGIYEIQLIFFNW